MYPAFDVEIWLNPCRGHTHTHTHRERERERDWCKRGRERERERERARERDRLVREKDGHTVVNALVSI